MLRERVRKGLTAGIIAAAATAGAVTGFGIRPGEPAEPFTNAGRLVLGIAATENGTRQLGAFAFGVLLHVGAALVWGVAFALLAAGLRGVRLLVAALLFAGAVYAARERVPELLRLGYGGRAFPPQLVVLHVVLALGLAAGIRLARLPGERTGATPRQRELEYLQRDPPEGGIEQ